MQQMTLSTGWQLKQRDPQRTLADDFAASDDWIAATAPGTVHQDLLAAGRIPDPFVGLNERDVQWIGEADWLYRCTFDLPDGFTGAPAVELCCDGLDTFATVWLNGQQVLSSDNMFVPQRVVVGSLLRAGSNNVRILFESALLRGREREAAQGQRHVWNGDPSRVYVRKAQYHYGWDWGPCLMTAGPWRPIRLEAWTARIADLHAPIEVAPDLGSAQLNVQAEIAAEEINRSADLMLQLSLYDPSGALLDTAQEPINHPVVQQRFVIRDPRLWWPRGYGDQPRYRLEVVLLCGTVELDRRTLRLGLRRLQLVQEPIADEPGRSFVFEINNTPIFCGGANWIPADSFLPRVTPERYRAWLELAADGNLLMLRVWGGGIYEEDVFYDLCDELGLLVWQDFMFACGIYPADAAFQTSVRAEAEAAVRRLRHHPSIVLWCGNNEDYQLAQSIGAYDAAFDGNLLATAFPARAIYERLLPEVCAALDPTRPYWPGSPYAGSDPDDPTVGDRHAWEVWKWEDYHNYPRYAGRFVSEFGMASAPDPATVAAFAPPEERYPASRTFEHHIKADAGPRRLAGYISDNLRLPATLDEYVYATQFVQAEALVVAYRGWRRRWNGPGRRAVAGALVWQLNDCWPVTSWAIVDYALRPKPAYYVVRRELASLAVGLARAGDQIEAWAINGTTEAVDAEIDLRQWSLNGALISAERRSIALPPNRSIELGAIKQNAPSDTVFAARLILDGEVVARATLWPEPFKYLSLRDPDIELARFGNDRVRMRAARPAKGVWLEGGDDVRWSDNMLDLLPDDEQIVVANGLGDHEIRLRWLTAP